MDSRLERAARALLGCNSRAPIGPDESSEWVAVSAEHLDNLRAALAAPEPAQAGEAVAREAARYATDDTARILSFGGVPRIEDIAAAKTGIVDRAVAHALRAKGAR